MTNTENNVAAQAGDSPTRDIRNGAGELVAIARHRCEPGIAAQAGDEPIEFYRLVGTAEWTEATTKRIKFLRELGKGQFEFRTLYFSPRATADVERDAARWRYWREKYGAECRMIPGAIWYADTPEKLDIAVDLCMPAIATTKPGA